MTTESLFPNYQSSIHLLEQDVKHLHDSIVLLHQLTHDQQPTLDSIQDAIIHSKEQAQTAQQNLHQAEEYQTSTISINGLLVLTGMVVTGIAYLFPTDRL
jgi:hypothetical protein